jgi:transcriptional regulator with XRE-family HTH domain
MTEGSELVDYLNGLMKNKGWSIRELARRMKVSHTTVHEVLNGRRKPTFEFCEALIPVIEKEKDYAGITIEDILQKAGLLPNYPQIEDEPTFKELWKIMRKMTQEEREEILEFALFKYRKS